MNERVYILGALCWKIISFLQWGIWQCHFIQDASVTKLAWVQHKAKKMKNRTLNIWNNYLLKKEQKETCPGPRAIMIMGDMNSYCLSCHSSKCISALHLGTTTLGRSSTSWPCWWHSMWASASACNGVTAQKASHSLPTQDSKYSSPLNIWSYYLWLAFSFWLHVACCLKAVIRQASFWSHSSSWACL